MRSICVDEGLLARIVLFIESAEPVSFKLFKAAVFELCRRVRDKAGHSILHDEQSVLYQHAFSQILVVFQDGSAVADVESGRNDFKMIAIGNRLDLAQTFQ